MKLRFIAPVAASVALIAAPAMATTGTGHKAKTEKPAKAPKPAKAKAKAATPAKAPAPAKTK